MTAKSLLELMAGDGPIPGRHVVVTAHPDDETVSFGGALSRLQDAVIVQLTTGADNPETAAVRAKERRAAFEAARWQWPVVDAVVPGRLAYQHVAHLVATVTDAAVGADVIWTHPYEGGHLDHDTAAYVCQQIAGPIRMEFASYYASRLAQVFGDFWPETSDTTVRVPLTGDILARKQAAVAAYASQAAILRKFSAPDIEAYRIAPRYDFTRPSKVPRCRWDVKGYLPKTHEWRRVVAQGAA